MIEPENADSENRHNEQHERSLAEARALFTGSDGSLGSIDEPTKKGFLEIARKGATVWNAWRKAHPHATPDFSRMDFRNGVCDFSGFHFPNPIAQEECVDFRDSSFGDANRFNKTVFGNSADFSRTHFFGRASFSQATFGDDASFTEADFWGHADFRTTAFGDNVDFANAQFKSSADFRKCHFSDGCFFNHSIFARRANFRGAVFSGFATFHAASFSIEADFVETLFEGTIDFSASRDESAPVASRQFQYVSFNGAVFQSRARFTGRQFLAATDFGTLRDKPAKNGETSRDKSTVFTGIPDFHGCKFHQDTSFDGAVFETPLNQEAARAFRTLKLAMEQHKATREEQRFFRLEMKAEHSSLPLARRWLSGLYAICSDYGFSLLRPLAALGLATLLIASAHGALANHAAGAGGMQPWVFTSPDPDQERTWQWLRYVLIDAIPVPGLDKTQIELREALFGKNGGIATAAMLLEMLHKLIALTCVFLFGLALRNLFKMKS